MVFVLNLGPVGVAFFTREMQPIQDCNTDFKVNSLPKLYTESFDVMRKLTQRIKQELREGKHCAIYIDEIDRVWPETGKNREIQIARFASANGWRLRYYREGFCAIFDNEPPQR